MAVKLKAATTIHAPRNEVFAFFVNFPESAKVLHSATLTEFVTSQTTGLGAEWTQHVSEPEGTSISQYKVVAFNSPESYTMTSLDDNSFETMEFRFAEVGEETKVEFDLTVRPNGFAKGIFLRLFSFMIVKYMRNDLERMRQAIELRSAE